MRIIADIKNRTYSIYFNKIGGICDDKLWTVVPNNERKGCYVLSVGENGFSIVKLLCHQARWKHFYTHIESVVQIASMQSRRCIGIFRRRMICGMPFLFYKWLHIFGKYVKNMQWGIDYAQTKVYNNFEKKWKICQKYSMRICDEH